MTDGKHIFELIAILVLLSIRTYSQQYSPTNIPITANGNQKETSITIDPLNSSHLMATWNDFDNSQLRFQPGYGFSVDGGNTWSTGVLVNVSGFDPSCAIDRSGREYFAYAVPGNGIGGLGAIDISYSTSNGAPWATYTVSALLESQDKPYLAVDNTGGTYDGRVYIAWTDFSNGGMSAIDFAYSSDHGQHWIQSAVQALDVVASVNATFMPTYSQPGPKPTPPPPPEPYVQFPEPVVGPDGTVYLVYYYSSDYNTDGCAGSIQFAKSENGGSTLSPPVSIASITVANKISVGNLNASSYPTLAVDPVSGNLYVAWTQYDSGDLNIYFMRSTDKGSSWSSPQIATQSTNKLQFFPWLTVNSSGTVSLSYYQGDANAVDVYEAESYNSCQSFAGNDTRLTPSSGYPNSGHWTCDYMGSASTANRNVFPIWTSILSDGSANIYTALYNSATDQAYQGKSFYWAATSYNNNHVIEKDASDRQHLVFQSNGEIFYRRSQDYGATWDITRRISTGDGQNSTPSIAVANDGSLLVVWQNYSPSNNNYQIRYSRSTDIGNSWNSYSAVASSVSCGIAQGPQPVIAAMNGSGSNMLCVWASSNGLSWRFSNNLSFFNGYQGTVQGTYSGCEQASLATYGPSSTEANLIYSDGWSTYSNRFDANSNTWSSQVVAGSGSYSRYPSICLNEWGGTYGVWSYWTGSHWNIRCYQGDAGSNSWSSWISDWGVSNQDSFYPVVSWYYDAQDQWDWILVDWMTWGTYTIWENSWSWIPGSRGPYEISSYGGFPNMSHEWSEETFPAVMYANFASVPYQITTESPGYPKRSNIAPTRKAISYRAVEIYDKASNTTLTFKLKGLNFRKYDYRQKLDLSLANVFEYLQSQDFVPDQGYPLNVQVTTSIVQRDTLLNGMAATVKTIPFTSIDAKMQVVNEGSIISEVPLMSNDLSTTRQENHSYDFGQTNGNAIHLIPHVRITGNYDEKDLVFQLVNGIEMEDSTESNPSPFTQVSVPLQLACSNYPNPFNPTTQISYALPHEGYVRVRVYDFLGREVRSLVDGNKAAGYYAVTFDASGLASGIYFYRLELDGNSLIRKMLLIK